MNKNTETNADDAVAAELAALLPRLPRTKITPGTISQTIIDRWYDYETEYRQTIAELRAELAAAREHAQTAHDQTAELGGHVVQLRQEGRKLRTNYLDVTTELAELRERIALDLERASNLHDQDAERHADERSPLLQAQAEALWDAARKIRSGKEGDGDGHQ